MSRKIILELADLEEHEWRLDDVFNQLAYLMVRIDDKSFNFDPMQLLTKAFSPGGVAANVKLPLESFKMIVQRLKAIRNEVDIRIMQNFWPLFHQIYLHVDDWNGAISHFINVHELWDRGQSLIPSKSMEKSYPKYESEFGTARQFIVYDPLDGVFSEQFHEHCRQLAFFMMLQPKRASKELTVAVLKSAHSLRNPRPINKLALFFHHAQAFAHYVVPEVKKQLPVALIYRMQEDTEALKDMNSVAKGDLLLQLCDRLTNDLVYNEYEKKVKPPLLASHLFHEFKQKVKLLKLLQPAGHSNNNNNNTSSSNSSSSIQQQQQQQREKPYGYVDYGSLLNRPQKR